MSTRKQKRATAIERVQSAYDGLKRLQETAGYLSKVSAGFALADARGALAEALALFEESEAPRQRRRRPAYGSAEWCETRGDDLGESPDY